ncbi:hypothetical protein F5Y04DRAFT_241879 [Hypomontagnella monticulosa]|nr:hypothetical protein F5Y04DRAFT_241879 [Hypomontagnella monticulosa]
MPNLATHCPSYLDTLPHSRPMRTSGLQRLPYEIMANIVGHLDIDEVFDLSRSSRHFQYLVREERFCRAIITAKASHTTEALEAQQDGRFSRALRRIAKRYQALAQASPYVVGIVGLADSYEYVNGILCYIIEARPKRWLRILDLRRSATYELVIDIPALIREAEPRSARSRKYKFRVLNHANGITSCLFSFALPNTENFLLVFKADEQQIVAMIPLESTSKIFVRNNKDYLFFGTHSEEGADGFRNWVLTGFDIHDRVPFTRKIHLANVVGYDMGSTVCFEIIDGYFYGLSNQTDFEIRETDWISYYHCFRFSLYESDPRTTRTVKMQTMKKEASWRRKHAEGPIDDRWGFLKLEKDEASGKINIIESRKEWLAGQSGSRRSYYITKVAFDEREMGGDETPEADEGNAVPRLSNGSIRFMDKFNNTTLSLRPPESFHPGDDSSTTPAFTRSQTHLCCYQRCCSTYFDLVDDTPSGSSSSRRLRLRTGYRKLGPIPYQIPPASDYEAQLNEIVKQRYTSNEIYFWPPEPDPLKPGSFLDKIYGILNPPGYVGSITASSDERSMIYATGEDTNGLKILVYISFDPAARLSGMLREKWILGERHTSSLPDGRTYGDPTNLGLEIGGITQHAGGVITGGGGGKDTAIGDFRDCCLPPYISDPPLTHATIMPPPEGCKPWAWIEKAMHHNLAGKSFTFAH